MPSAEHLKHILILAGGPSPEHHVSIKSAKFLQNALSNTSIKATVIVLTSHGNWLDIDSSSRALDFGHADTEGGSRFPTFEEWDKEYGCVFPLIHGKFGEDGAMQGFLEVLRLPYIGCGISSSALCLDKAIFKDVARTHNLPQTQYAVLDLSTYRDNHHEAIQFLLKEIPLPWIIKPTRSGSSLGVSKVNHKSDIQPTLEESFKHGNQLIIEEALSDFAELEMGVIGNADNPNSVQVSLVGEANYEGDCQTNSVKYSENGTQFNIPAKLPEAALHECSTLAQQAFRLFHCKGLSRVDVMYDRTKKVALLNEINTIPGLTEQSMFLQLWEKSGMGCEELMGRLVDLAVDRDKA